MPQVTFHPLPVLQEGEGLEVDRNENKMNEGITINYVDGDNSWTLVQRCKKKKVKKDNQEEKWNAQQRENFLHFGDIYRGEPYKSYHNVDIGPPVANIPLQQPVAQPPVVQINPPPPTVRAPVQPSPVAAAAYPHPVIIITPLPKQAAPGSQKHPGLETIPEEEEEDEPEPQGAGYQSPSASSSSSSSSSSDASFSTEDYGTPPNTPAHRPREPRSPFGARGDNLLTEFRRLAFTPDANIPGWKYEVQISKRGEGAAKVLGATKPFQHQLAEAGPPSQRTRQMQKDLEKTLLRRYEESKALEKKKKKEIKKEQP
jgi:hypothetical protein